MNEFLKKFESYTEEKGTPKERATLLYEQYLQEEVQMELVERRDNYELMKIWLIRRFGDVRVITDSILKPLVRDDICWDKSNPANLTTYFRKLNSAVKKIQELKKTVDMPLAELESHIYSVDFISKLLSFVPDKTKFDFIDKQVWQLQTILPLFRVN